MTDVGLNPILYQHQVARFRDIHPRSDVSVYLR